MSKPILCLDFDGVIHNYSSGWKGANVISDPPVHLAFEFIIKALNHFTVMIFSSRSNQPGGLQAMKDWMEYWAQDELPANADKTFLSQIGWPLEKPAAMITIDDRALTFDGTWPTVESLLAFQPWNKR